STHRELDGLSFAIRCSDGESHRNLVSISLQTGTSILKDIGCGASRGLVPRSVPTRSLFEPKLQVLVVAERLETVQEQGGQTGSLRWRELQGLRGQFFRTHDDAPRPIVQQLTAFAARSRS